MKNCVASVMFVVCSCFAFNDMQGHYVHTTGGMFLAPNFADVSSVRPVLNGCVCCLEVRGFLLN